MVLSFITEADRITVKAVLAHIFNSVQLFYVVSNNLRPSYVHEFTDASEKHMFWTTL